MGFSNEQDRMLPRVNPIRSSVSIAEITKREIQQATGIVIPSGLNQLEIMSFEPKDGITNRLLTDLGAVLPPERHLLVSEEPQRSLITPQAAALDLLLTSVLGHSQNTAVNLIKDFQEALNKRKGKPLLIIRGHGSSRQVGTKKEWFVGEVDETTSLPVSVEKILGEIPLDDYSAVLLNICNLHSFRIYTPSRAPIFYAEGEQMGLSSLIGRNHPLMSAQYLDSPKPVVMESGEKPPGYISSLYFNVTEE